MKASDYIIKRIAEETDHVFMVVGGGGMHLFDSLRKSATIKHVCNHTEQAAALAAEGYSRISNRLGVVMVTSGPGGTNAITGVACGWHDYIPMLVISGQANSKTLINREARGKKNRQEGTQETDIARIAEPITKQAVTITKAWEIPGILETAIFTAKQGPCGPVWLDIPIDIQAEDIPEESILEASREKARNARYFTVALNIALPNSLIEDFNNAKRPLVLVGHGVRLSKSVEAVLQLTRQLAIPIVTTKNGFDAVPYNHPYYVGTVGTNGNIAANKAIQNCDFLLSLGSSFSMPTVGYRHDTFAKNAVIYATGYEGKPISRIKWQYTHTDDVLRALLKAMEARIINTAPLPWATQCMGWKEQFPSVREAWRKRLGYVNPYVFFDVLSKHTYTTDTIVTDQGCSFYCFTQAYKVKYKQRAFTNGGLAPMGYGLPAAIGAAFATNERVVCVHGEGGLMMTLGELQTIKHHKLPIILFVFNNDGYLSIKHTQVANFNGQLIGCDPSSGISFPPLEELAKTFGMHYRKIVNHFALDEQISSALELREPTIVEVLVNPMQPYTPKLIAYKNERGQLISPELDDMTELD